MYLWIQKPETRQRKKEGRNQADVIQTNRFISTCRSAWLPQSSEEETWLSSSAPSVPTAGAQEAGTLPACSPLQSDGTRCSRCLKVKQKKIDFDLSHATEKTFSWPFTCSPTVSIRLYKHNNLICMKRRVQKL